MTAQTTASTILAEAEATLDTPQPIVTANGVEKQLLTDTVQVTAEVDQLRTAFNNRDTTSIIMFATDKQRAATSAAETMIAGVRNKQLGSVGDGLSDLSLKIKGLDVASLRENDEPSWFGKLLGKVSPLASWLESYNTLEAQIDNTVDMLREHQMQMFEDVKRLDILYDLTLSQFDGLEVSISAGVAFLEELNTKVLPPLQAKAASEGADQAVVADYQDKVDFRDKIERKVHDLKLTRQVVLQNLPSIRMTQQSDTGLIEKIESVVNNTIPLWKQQLAVAVAAANTKAAADGVNDVLDLNDQLIRDGAKSVRQANVEARKTLERGMIDIEAIEEANKEILGMITDTQAIYQEAKEKRVESDQRLSACESALKQTITTQG